MNLGIRYDLITGYQYDQSTNPNFVKIQAAGAAGLLSGIKGMRTSARAPNDTNNWQPRVGLAWDLRGDGRDVIRAGWGIYMDMAYTNSNGLFAAFDAQGAFGTVLNVLEQSGIRNPDGSFYQIGQPVSNIASQNQADPNSLPLFGQWTDPRLQMPYTRQLAVGWSHEISDTMVFTADFVRADGRDLNTRPRVNVYIPDTTTRRLAFLNLQPNALGTRPGISQGTSDYTAGIFGLKRRLTNGIDFTATYTLAKAKSVIGNASDELNSNNLQDAYLLYDDPRVDGPTARTDARHSGTLAGVFQMKSFTIAPNLPVPVAASGQHHRGSRPQPQQRAERHPGHGLRVQRHRPGPKGDRHVRDLELRPRRVAHPDEPARVLRLQALREHAPRGDWRDLQPRQRQEPLRLRDQPAARHRRAEPELHAADRVLGRLPEPQAAGRSDRLPGHVLGG